MIARVEDLPQDRVARYRQWWSEEMGWQTRQSAFALYPLAPRYAAYFTSEQLADYEAFGVIVFQGSAGTPCVLQLGTHVMPENSPPGAYCMRIQCGLVEAFVAFKLLWQADECAARSIAGRDGARLS